MEKLRRFDLVMDHENEDWVLKQHGADRATRRFETKQNALGNLREIVEPGGGSVRIYLARGPIQEERTYPRSRDPRESKG